MPRYTFRCPMRWSDMDAYGHVNNVQFLTYLEEARVEMFFELGRRRSDDEADMLATGVLVARHEIRYTRPLVHRNEPIPIDVWVTRIGGASFELAYEVHDEGNVYATAASTLVTFDFRTERPRRLTASERSFLLEYLET